MRRIVLAAVLLACPGLTLASPVSYDYLDLSYLQVDPDEGDLEPKGFGLKYSNLFTESLFFIGSIARVETDDAHIPDVNPALGDFNGTLVSTTVALGLGGRHGLTDSTDLQYTGSLLHAQISGDGENGGDVDDDDVGYAASVGLRSALNDTFEGSVGVGYGQVFDEGDTSFGAGLLAHVSEGFGLLLNLDMNDDAKLYTLGIRFKF